MFHQNILFILVQNYLCFALRCTDETAINMTLCKCPTGVNKYTVRPYRDVIVVSNTATRRTNKT